MTAQRTQGFTLVEILVAVTITVALFGIIFQLFHQNERIFRDQSLITEMRQAARATISQIADDIRIGGQGVPVYMASLQPMPSETTVVVLHGSNAKRLHLRTGLTNTASHLTSPVPLDLTIANATTLTVGDATVFSTQIGTAPVGRYVFVSGAIESGGWVRAAVNSVSGASKSLRITPTEASDQTTQFTATAAVSLEEAVAIYKDGTGIRRTTATNTSNPLSTGWAPANELATNVVDLTFTYYDLEDRPVVPDTLERRAQVARIDSQVVLRTAAPLSDGTIPTYALSVRSIPRNLRVR